MFKNLKIGTKLAIGFFAISILMGTIGYFSIRFLYSTQNNNRMVNEFIILVLEAIDTKSVDEFNTVNQNLNTLKNELDAKALLLISDEVTNLYRQKLEQDQLFIENYPLEKAKRYAIRDIVYTLNDPTIQKDYGLVIYYSKEALYQYGDEAHLKEWYDSILQLKKDLAVAGSEAVSDCDEYYQIAQTMGGIVLKEKEIETEENSKIKELLNTSTTIQSETTNLVKTILIYLVVSIVTGMILALSLGIFIFRSITKPIADLQKGLKIIQKGDLDYRVGTNSQDEVGELSREFDKLTVAVKESRAIVDQKVEEQTQEITMKNKQMEDQQKAILNILEDVEQEKKQVTIEKVKYEGLFTSIADGIIATDHEENIVLINEAGKNMLGWKEEDLVGKKITDIISVVDEKGQKILHELRPITIATKTKKPFITSVDTNYYYVRKDGTKFPVALTAAPIILNNELIGVIDVFRDVSHEKDVDRMKTEFISLASHQLRTPLSAMKWFGEMLLAGDAGELTEEQKEYVQNIYDSNERMVELVNSLLNISRIESGRLLIDPKLTDAGVLIKEVVKELQQKLTEKHLQCILSIHENLPMVMLDPKLIRQVYINLLTNAIKYTPKDGEIQVYLSKNETDLISQVTDNGLGIPKEEQGRVFEKFFRGKNIMKLETEGTGLGLYLIKSIIESSGGKIWFKSEEGEGLPANRRGTTFWFTIPLSGMTAKQGDVGLEEKIMMGVKA